MKKKTKKKAKPSKKPFGVTRRQGLAALRAFLQWNGLTEAQRESFFEVDEMVDGHVDAVGNELLRCLSINVDEALPQLWDIIHHFEGVDDAVTDLEKMANKKRTAKKRHQPPRWPVHAPKKPSSYVR